MKRKVIFAGGGTGGHLFPAFALAAEIKQRLTDNCEIKFLASGRKLEMNLISNHGYSAAKINIQGIKRGSVVSNLTFPFVLMLGIVQSIMQIIKFNPDFVIGTGGYTSFPVILAAKITNRPTFIQEQNSYAGIASRKAARFADLIFIAYEETAKQLQYIEKCILSGNPINDMFGKIERDEASQIFNLDPEKTTVLIFGGSQGAESINNAIKSSLPEFAASSDMQILWQVGNHPEYIESFKASGCHGKALNFIDNMPAAFAVSDLVVCRAGALTLSELTACGKPAILIPYPHATDDHQTKNAQVLVNFGAAMLIKDDELANINLYKHITDLLNDESKLLEMSMVSQTLGRKDAAAAIVQRIFEFMGWR